MAGIDDEDLLLGDLLGDLDLELEARFEELEQRAELDEARAQLSEAERRARGRANPQPTPQAAADPLKDLKAAFASKPEAGTTEYLLVLCSAPACGRKNRLDRARALTAEPRCGACGAALVFT